VATSGKNLSYYDENTLPDASGMSIGIVVSEWNREITEGLLKGAVDTLTKLNVKEKNIHIKYVPGSFELALGAQLLSRTNFVSGIIALGSVIQGETKHFDFVCQATTQGIMKVSIKHNLPVILGLLTDNTLQQAIDRSGGKHGNKGIECAIACVKMIALQEDIESTLPSKIA
jgi:6,7-dimethyl-8-ribityllumazine synthase